MYLLHLLGSSMLVVLLSIILVDTLFSKKKFTQGALIGRVLLVVMLFVLLLRTK